jgi:hypothetical protein
MTIQHQHPYPGMVSIYLRPPTSMVSTLGHAVRIHAPQSTTSFPPEFSGRCWLTLLVIHCGVSGYSVRLLTAQRSDVFGQFSQTWVNRAAGDMACSNKAFA